MNKIDVVILTKNSAKTLKYVLHGVFNAIPVNKLVIVDYNSIDETLRIAKLYDAKIIKGAPNIATARYQGVLEVETEWFCFIDSDIYIFPSWYKQLKKWKSLPRVAWLQGLTIEHSKILNSYAVSKTLRYAKYGCIALSNSLLKKDVVLKCRDWLDKKIHAGEDFLLYKTVKAEGYRVLIDTNALCLHLPDCFFHDIYALYRSGYSSRLRSKYPSIKYLGVSLILLKEGIIRVMLTKDPRVLFYFLIILASSYIAGYYKLIEKRVKHLMTNIDKKSKEMINQIVLRRHVRY